MQRCAIILALYILGVNFSPVLGMVDLDGAVELSSSATVPSDSDDQQCGDCCNPFVSCDSCLGFEIPWIAYTQKPAPIIFKPVVDCNDASPDLFIHAIWHPPKV